MGSATGDATYQWYYNNVVIAGSTSDTIHIPLYKSGTYTVKITSAAGCTVTSDPINIQFVKCGGCDINAKGTISCGELNESGQQTYNLTFTVNNTLGAGAGISI